LARFKRGSLTLARQVFNTPQMILPDDLQTIAQYLVNRANGDLEVSPKSSEEVEQIDINMLSEEERRDYKRRQLGITNDGKRGNLNITGTLVYKAGQMDGECMELTSYEKLLSTFKAQVSEGIEELVLHVDSGGGQAYGVFETAKEMRSIANEKGIKIISYIDGMSASAAYALTSISDEIIANPDAEAGSVGVVVQLINNSKMLEKVGLTRTFVYNGDQKIPFDAEGEFSTQFLSALQKKVDKTGLEFNTFVANNRNMSVEDVIATEAALLDSDEALDVGFIDKVMTRSEFFDDYLPEYKQSTNIYNLQHEGNMSKQANENVSVETLQAQLSTITTEKETLSTQLETATTQLTQLTTEKENLEAQLTAAKSELDSVKEAKAEQEKLAKTEKRRATLATALGKDNEKLESILTSTEALSDEAFDIVASGYGAAIEKQAETLDELGGEGEESETQKKLEQEKELSLAEKIAAAAKQI